MISICVGVVYPYLREKKKWRLLPLKRLKRRRLLSQMSLGMLAFFFFLGGGPSARERGLAGLLITERFTATRTYEKLFETTTVNGTHVYYGYTTIIARANNHHRKVGKEDSSRYPLLFFLYTPKLNDVVFQLQRVANSPYATRRAQRVLRNGYEIVRPTDIYFPVRHGTDAKHDGFFIFF